MAIARGAGTEIIRAHHFEDVTGDAHHQLIIGEQHHIYTVLSLIVFCSTLNVATDYITCYIQGYDAFAGTTNEPTRIFRTIIPQKSTYVWNDKFSFNGCEGTNFTGAMNSVADQNLIADQAESGIPQELKVYTNAATTVYDITVTFIDQNNV